MKKKLKGRERTEGQKHLLPERSCLIRPLLLDVLTGRKSLNQVISGSGLPLAAQSIVAVRERSTTFSWGPMSMVGNPDGSWSSGKIKYTSQKEPKPCTRLVLLAVMLKYCIHCMLLYNAYNNKFLILLAQFFHFSVGYRFFL